MSDWSPLIYDLRKALQTLTPGEWVAFEPTTATIIAEGATADVVEKAAAAKQCADPILIRVPQHPPEDGDWTTGQEPPHGLILNAWLKGNVVPFLGAGASLVGGLPSAATLVDALAYESSFPPSGIGDRDLARVSSYFLSQGDRADLRTWLRNKLDPAQPFKPGPLHQFLASESGRQARLIMTTNYDRLIETALEAAGVPFDVLVYPTDTTMENANAALWIPQGGPPQYRDPKEEIPFDRLIVYKMHGSLARDKQWDSFVITEDDYMRFLERMIEQTAIPTGILNYLMSRRLLFLGYGLRDWNLRIVLQKLDRAERETIGWAIQWRPSPVECVIWKRRKVRIYDQSLDDFTKKMESHVPPPGP